ncbi:MAG: hypothetical protein IJ877_01830 [Candidatus Gastranaerophilales bacterium]|nr:hypothetical protein [Candidatus Gastranaerophilales bacterium]
MLKLLHSSIAVILLGCFLSAPSIAIKAKDTIPIARDISKNGEIELIQNEINVQDLDIEPIDTKKVKQSVIPDPAKEGKKVIGLFLKTMAGVGFCAIILYLILLFVKKFYSSAFISQDFEELENLDLSTPNNKNDALKSFLNRTR